MRDASPDPRCKGRVGVRAAARLVNGVRASYLGTRRRCLVREAAGGPFSFGSRSTPASEGERARHWLSFFQRQMERDGLSPHANCGLSFGARASATSRHTNRSVRRNRLPMQAMLRSELTRTSGRSIATFFFRKRPPRRAPMDENGFSCTFTPPCVERNFL